jgi:hypothetical protein
MSASVSVALSSASASPVLPSFETIARLTPLADPEGREIKDVLRELNQAIEAAGIEFGENSFSWLRYDKCAPDRFEDYRWIDCTAVRGSNEGYYIHITLVPREYDRKPSILIATAKTWDWASALAIAAAATRLLAVW